LDKAGKISVHLSLWDSAVSKFPADRVRALQSVDGCRPMQLVMQRATRGIIMDLSNIKHGLNPAGDDQAERPEFNCCPDLRKAIVDAVTDYHSDRAPLYPLPVHLRLGYLDEEDFITCKAPLWLQGQDEPQFVAGERYRVETQTIQTIRRRTRIGFDGEPETIELTGSELLFEITGRSGRCYFVSPEALAEGITIHGAVLHHETTFTTLQLVDYFEIPEVPDISAARHETYQLHLRRVEKLELATSH